LKATLQDILISARPRQWTKNFVCFAALAFSGHLTNAQSEFTAFVGFCCFCLASSGIYIFNDICDRKRDQAHSSKRNRPIAAGRLSVPMASCEAAACLLAALALAAFLAPRFGHVLVLFLLLNIFYSLYLRNILILDVVSIALGFVLRVQSGIEALQASQSAWVLLCMFFMALFLGLGKRYGEIISLQGEGSISQRSVLHSYSLPLLNNLLCLSATTALVCYSLYAVTVQKNETFLITIIPVTLGLARYLLLVIGRTEGQDPDELLTRDKPLVLTILVWALLCIAVLYGNFHLFPSFDKSY
jgi:4-hydroxybenzoate polyprenyltransferase